MPITEKQRQRRLETPMSGGSDVPSLLGCNPYRNIYDQWLVDTGRVVPEDKPNLAMQIGNLAEPVVIGWMKDRLGPGRSNVNRVNHEYRLSVNLDVVFRAGGEPGEIKTSGLAGGPPHPRWGEEGTGEVPDHVIAQAHAAMIVTDTDVCHVGAWLGGRGLLYYLVERSADLAKAICEFVPYYWEHYVGGDNPPPDVWPHMDVVKRARRTPRKLISLPPPVIQQVKDLDAELKVLKKRHEHAKAQLLAMMGDAEAVNGDAETGAYTYYEQTTNRIDTKRLRAEQPDIVKEYTKTSTTRVLRPKKGLIEDE